MSILSEETHHTQQCEHCHSPIPANRFKRKRSSLVKYCSNKCAQAAWRGRDGCSIHTSVCPVCEKSFSYFAKSPKDRKYCSRTCGRTANISYLQMRRPNAHTLPKGTIGAISELIISTDLLRRGFEVFRALSPNCSCDLAILHKSKLIRVEVRTASRSSNGKLTFSFHEGEGHRHDLLALVADNGSTIEYRPSLPELFPDPEST